jgi:hypothetical protein
MARQDPEIVNSQLRREIASEKETAYLLKSEMTKRHILDALQGSEAIPFEAAVEKLGI